jgi:PadR family transcriptional regulator, regulatory protein PadR
MKQDVKFRKELVGSTTCTLVLSVLREAPKHGYQIAQIINERSDGSLQWREGTIYPMLHRLEKQGLIEGEWQINEDENPRSKPKRVYHLTDAGLAVFSEQKEEWEVFSLMMSKLLGYGNG